MDFVPINQTSQYASALVEIKAALIKLRGSSSGLFRTSIRVPDQLTEEVNKRGEMAYDAMRNSLTKHLSEFCPIGEWSRGEEPTKKGATKKYIQFYLLPVKEGA